MYNEETETMYFILRNKTTFSSKVDERVLIGLINNNSKVKKRKNNIGISVSTLQVWID